jgi:hypothetical protein
MSFVIGFSYRSFAISETENQEKVEMAGQVIESRVHEAIRRNWGVIL